MSLIESLILGLVQGLTEFLPVSSSGHLVIVEKLFNVRADDLVFEVLVHFGTLVAVIIYFREKLYAVLVSFFAQFSGHDKSPDDRARSRLGWYLILGTVPAAIVGLSLESYVEIAFGSPRWTSAMLLVTAMILILTRWVGHGNSSANVPRTILIGCAQALAIMPGISRSGTTISAGIFSGMNKSEAAEFSFLLSIPAVAGATLKETPLLFSQIGNIELIVTYLAGALVAGVVGYLSIAFLMNLIRKGRFFYFGVYCAVVGILGIIFL